MRMLKSLLEKEFPENKIYVKLVKGKQKYSPEIQRVIEQKWKSEAIISKAKRMPLFNGHLLRFEGFIADKELTFFTSDTMFKEVIGVRSANSVLSEFGTEYLPNALGVTAVCITRDKKILILYRYFAGYGDYWHLPSSFVYESRDNRNPSVAIRNGLKKELLVYPDEIIKNIFIGLYEQPQVSETSAIFKTTLGIDSNKLGRNLERIKPSQKLFHDYKFLEDKKSSILNFLRKYDGKIHHGGYTSLKVYLKNLELRPRMPT